jgi:hypothetical protein
MRLPRPLRSRLNFAGVDSKVLVYRKVATDVHMHRQVDREAGRRQLAGNKKSETVSY